MYYPLAILVIAGIAAYALTRTGKILLKLSLDIRNARLNKVQIDYSYVRFDLVVENPTSREAVIQGYDVSIVYNDKVIATLFKEGMSAPLKAHNTTTLKDITAKISSLSIVDNLIDLITGKYQEYITIKGSIKADGISFPFSKQIKLITQES
jgi:hypothetical protein